MVRAHADDDLAYVRAGVGDDLDTMLVHNLLRTHSYLSPFIEHPASEYARRRQADRIAPIPEPEVEAEIRQWALDIRRLGVKVTRYDIREMIY